MAFVPTAPTPRLDERAPITVGHLFEQLITLFTEEPRRLNMNDWVSRLDGVHRLAHVNERPDDNLPACGTVGCVAGWGLVLLRPPTSVAPQELQTRAEDLMEHALGFEEDGYRTAGNLFVADWSSLDGDVKDIPHVSRPMFPAPGTPEQAAVIVRRIRAYMTQHPEILDREIDVATIHTELLATQKKEE